METYLVHHGILGQKWGVRRYQTEDGSWTEEGKRRRGLSEKDSSRIKNAASTGFTGGKTAVNDIRQARNAGKDVKRAKAQYAALEEAKNMTDQQLRERTQRLNLENNYINAVSQQQVDAGAAKVDQILAYTAAALGIAATAVSIWVKLR